MNIGIFKRIHINNSITCRWNSSKTAAKLTTDVFQKLKDDEIKPRHHPGINHSGRIRIPNHIQKGITKCIGDFPLKSLINDGQALSRYLNARHPPAELLDVKRKLKAIGEEIDNKFPPPTNTDSLTEEELKNLLNKRQQRIQRILKQRVMLWKNMNYGQYEALVYAIGRSAQEYAILVKIFREIHKRDMNFKPRSYFDFGSGVGSGMWAASDLWKDHIFEYFNVDSSREMNDLSDMILREGIENKESFLKNVFYRQFLPANDIKYDLIVSSFSLFELPNLQSRQKTLLNLWNKCNNYLVLVEEGTKKAFNLIEEAREYLLKQNTSCYVFSPCPHDLKCPRQKNAEDKTPCNFEVTYEPLEISSESASNTKHLYSYLVLKKGVRDKDNLGNWPRIIRPTLVKSKHTICRMCTADGNLQEIIFTSSKHGKETYRCARSSKWGDSLPIEISEK